MLSISIDKSREDDFIELMEEHEEVLDVWREVTKGCTRIIVDAADTDRVLADIDEFVLDPHTHKAKSVRVVAFL